MEHFEQEHFYGLVGLSVLGAIFISVSELMF